MNKTRSDAKWLSLTPPQVDLLEKWMFEECLGYSEIWKRAREQFAFAGSLASIQRFHARALRQRQLEAWQETTEDAVEMARLRGGEDDLRAGAMKYISLQFFERAGSGTETSLAALAKILLQNETNQVRRQQMALRQRQVELAEKQWEFNALEAAKAASPLLQNVLNRLEKEKPTPTYKEWINSVRMAVFGCAPERVKPLPEEPVMPTAPETEPVSEASSPEATTDEEAIAAKPPIEPPPTETPAIAPPPLWCSESHHPATPEAQWE